MAKGEKIMFEDLIKEHRAFLAFDEVKIVYAHFSGYFELWLLFFWIFLTEITSELYVNEPVKLQQLHTTFGDDKVSFDPGFMDEDGSAPKYEVISMSIV